MWVHKARRRIAEQELNRVLRKMEPRLAARFVEAVRHVRSRAVLRRIAEALEAGNVEAAIAAGGIEALGERLRGEGLEPGQPSFRDELHNTFAEGGVAGARQLPRAVALRATLDVTNPQAVSFLRSYVPTLIVGVTRQTRDAVQDAVLRGFEEGRPAPKIAREIRDSIGLTTKQSQAVSNLRRQLETGELGRGKHPETRRLSATERAQAGSIFRSGGESSARVNALVERYRDSLTNRRAKNIARTEAHRAHVNGQRELWDQAQEQGLIQPDRTRRFWIVTPDDRLRDDHAVVPDMNPNGVGMNEPFNTPVGPVMAPGESGNPGFDILCRCTEALEFTDE